MQPLARKSAGRKREFISVGGPDISVIVAIPRSDAAKNASNASISSATNVYKSHRRELPV